MSITDTFHLVASGPPADGPIWFPYLVAAVMWPAALRVAARARCRERHPSTRN